MGKHQLKPESEPSFWWLAAAVFALLTLVNYLPVLAGKVPFPRDKVLQFAAYKGMPRSEAWQPTADIGDLVTAFYPARAFAARAVHQGALPLWNPYFLGGAPFVANPQSSLFYPPNLLYYFFSLPTAWTLCLMLRMFLSAIFMTLFVRSIGGSKWGSIFSGIVFSLCGFMTAWQGQPMSDAAIWLPLVCYAVLRLRKEPSGFSIALAAIAFAMPVLAGHPETAAHVTLVGLAIAVVTGAYPRPDFRFLLKLTAAGFLAIGLASVQIVPTLEWLAQMPAPLDIRWPALPINQAPGWVTRDVLRGPNSAGILIPESAAYVGMITLLAAPLGLFHRVRRHAVFLFALMVAAIAVAYGVQPIHWLATHTPVLAGLKNNRMIFVAGFAIAALGGLGISVLEEQVPLSIPRRSLALGLIAFVFLLTFVLVYQLQLATAFKVEFMRRPSFSRALLFVGLIPILWRLYGGLAGRAFPVAVCAIAGFDLLTFAYRYTGFAGRDEIFPRTAVFDFLAKDNDPAGFRIATMGLPYSTNANIIYGVPSADGYESRLIPPHLAFSLDYIDNTFSGISLVTSRLLKFNDRRLDLLNVKYLAAASRSPEFEELMASGRFPLIYNNGNVALFENKSVLPRAFAVPVSGVQLLGEMDQQLERLRNPAFDPQRAVIVSRISSSLKTQMDAPHAPGTPFGSSVKIVQSGANDLSLRVVTSEPAVLLASQTYYPGWQATVDGNATDVFPANVSLTGIAVPAGVHEVVLAFRPLTFKTGAALSVVAGVILIVLTMTRRCQNRPENDFPMQPGKMDHRC